LPEHRQKKKERGEAAEIAGLKNTEDRAQANLDEEKKEEADVKAHYNQEDAQAKQEIKDLAENSLEDLPKEKEEPKEKNACVMGLVAVFLVLH